MAAVLEEALNSLQQHLTLFEKQYGWPSLAFYERFEKGELGDDADFFEWSATWEMSQQLQTRGDL